MSDYLTEGWPLGSTSTVYMNGNSVYHVRHHGKPGIVATVELSQEQAEAIREVVAERIREAQADAWDEGHRTYVQREMDDCRCGAYYEGECGCGKYGTGKIITPNPYRTEP